MKHEERIQLIIEFANKVLQYPKSSKGYDPVDAMNLQMQIQKYEDEMQVSKIKAD